MKLLVSVSRADEVLDALAGGADIIDAKDPRSGALGAVSIEALRDIRDAVAGACPVTAAIGDATGEAAIEQIAFEFASAGVAFVKVGFAGIDSPARIAALTGAAVRGATAGVNGATGVVVVMYADRPRVNGLAQVAADAGARGLLLDTADKQGPGLGALLSPMALAEWVACAHDHGLFAAIAGKLTADDLPLAQEAGADIAGVRSAACDGDRLGRVSAESVRRLRELIDLLRLRDDRLRRRDARGDHHFADGGLGVG